MMTADNAPRKAHSVVAAVPERKSMPAAAPALAPEDTPMTSGEANELRNTVWYTKPQTPRAKPPAAAMTVRLKRNVQNTRTCCASPDSSPRSVRGYLPTNRLATIAASSMKRATRENRYVFLRYTTGFMEPSHNRYCFESTTPFYQINLPLARKLCYTEPYMRYVDFCPFGFYPFKEKRNVKHKELCAGAEP